MSDLADPSVTPPRRAGRRATDPALDEPRLLPGQTAPRGRNLPAVVPGARARDTAPPAGPVEAQILGQDGQKRGLRGGQPVLEKARSAYLGTEWSGSADRRPKRGVFTRTEI